MKSLAKRLQVLEAGRDSSYDNWSDAELLDRINELTVQLRPYGLDSPLLDGGSEDAERLRVTIKMLTQSEGQNAEVHQATH